MPTYDLEDNASPGLPRLGIIRLGTREAAKSRDGKDFERPKESPFFIFTDAPNAGRAYGVEPGDPPSVSEILILLPFPTIEENVGSWHKLYRGKVCVCCGDGRRIRKLISDDMTQRLVQNYEPEMACPGIKHDLYERCADCKPELTMMVLVRDPNNPRRLVDGMGYYQIRTHSRINTSKFKAQLKFIEDFQKRRGLTLQGVPMKLRRVLADINYQDKKDGKIKPTQKWLLDLEFDREWSLAAGQAMHALGMGGVPLALPQPVDTVTGEIIDENEFEPLPEAPAPARSEAAGKRNGSSLIDDSLELPIDPQKRLQTFAPAEATLFWPFIAKRYNKRPSSLHELFYQVTGYKKLEECDWSFAEVLKAFDEHTQLERVQT